MLKVKIKKVRDVALPEYAHDGDSGSDLRAAIDYTLKPLERAKIPAGIKLEIPKGYEGQIRPRSGLAVNHGITVLNTPGTIDSGYRGEIEVILINLSQKNYEIKKGDKIAQLVFSQINKATLEETVELENSQRGENGFGSTGK